MREVSRLYLIRHLVERVGVDKARYLEIGVASGKTWNGINAALKLGVDIRAGPGTHRMTSDLFFIQNTERFDVVFVDGRHSAEQVFRDTTNALAYLRPGGAIVLHDCNPKSEIDEKDARNGDVWKAFVHFRTLPDLDAACGNFNYGCGVIRVRPNTDRIVLPCDFWLLRYPRLTMNRQKWLRLMDWEELKAWL